MTPDESSASPPPLPSHPAVPGAPFTGAQASGPPVQPWASEAFAPQQAGAAAAPVYQYVPAIMPGRVSGRVSDFREATITLDADGITLDGKAYYPVGKQLVVLALSACVGVLIGVILLEYALRDPKRLRVGWDGVDAIVFQPDKQKACIVYREPGRPPTAKPLSLAFKLLPPYYENFAGAARYFAPAKVRDGKIAGPNPWWAIAVLVLFFVLIIVAAVASGGK